MCSDIYLDILDGHNYIFIHILKIEDSQVSLQHSENIFVVGKRFGIQISFAPGCGLYSSQKKVGDTPICIYQN